MLVKIGKELSLDVDISRIPGDLEDEETMLGKVLYMGLRNILMDSHAGVTEKDNPEDYQEKSLLVATKKLESIYAGVIRAAIERESDPVRRIALDKAQAIAKAIWAKTAKKGDKFEHPRKQAAEYLAAHPELMVKAQRDYDEQQEAITEM